jgi:hypothetical protein
MHLDRAHVEVQHRHMIAPDDLLGGRLVLSTKQAYSLFLKGEIGFQRTHLPLQVVNLPMRDHESRRESDTTGQGNDTSRRESKHVVTPPLSA